MTEEKAEYNIDKLRREFSALRKYAAMQSASEDKIGVQRIYIDITGEWYTALILDEIIFWTLPREKRVSGLRVWKDGVLWLAVNRSEWWERKRLKKRQADRAIEKLIDQGLVIKQLFKFNNVPTVHLRLNVPVFFEKYSDALTRIHPPEDESDSTSKTIQDLYEMMGFSTLPNGEIENPTLPNGDAISPNGDAISPNGEIFNSPDTSSTHPSHGANAQKRKPATIEEAIFSDQPVTEDLLDINKQKLAEMQDSANLIDTGCPGAYDLALAFMQTRDILLPLSKAKGQRKAAREMLDMGVKAEHVKKATRHLVKNNMTVVDLFSVSKTAIDYANKPDIPERKAKAL